MGKIVKKWKLLHKKTEIGKISKKNEENLRKEFKFLCKTKTFEKSNSCEFKKFL
jgi:hypothetical protein